MIDARTALLIAAVATLAYLVLNKPKKEKYCGCGK
jgi:hypothetical protein